MAQQRRRHTTLDATAQAREGERPRPALIERVLRKTAHARVPSSVVLLAVVGALMLRTAALTQVFDVPAAAVGVHEVGNPQSALERIPEENFISLEELDRLANAVALPEAQRLVFQYAPLILEDAAAQPGDDDTVIGVYYLLSTTEGEDTSVTTIQYFLFITDENGGTLVRDRLALFGQPIDRELIYRVTIIDGEVASSYYQAPGHRLVPVGDWGDGHPVFEIASANNNFRPVYPRELELRKSYRIRVPLPRHEHVFDPANDPDFVALAASEVMDQYGINLSHYIYVEFQNPAYNGIATVSVRIQGRWYYLHDSIAGLTRPGYNKVGIYVGFAPYGAAIEEIWITTYARNEIDIEVISVYLFPRLEFVA